MVSIQGLWGWSLLTREYNQPFGRLPEGSCLMLSQKSFCLRNNVQVSMNPNQYHVEGYLRI